MYQQSKAYNVYKTNSVNYASKEQLLLMLVEGAVKFAKVGRQAIENKDISKAHKSLTRAQDIYYELMATLDVSKGGKWAENLLAVYDFIVKTLAEANVKKDVKSLDKVIPLMEEIKDTWNEVYKISKLNSK